MYGIILPQAAAQVEKSYSVSTENEDVYLQNQHIGPNLKRIHSPF